METSFSFDGKLFAAAAEAAWVFVLLPVGVADEIGDLVPRRRGFGSVRVAVRIGSSLWGTSIFPSKEDRSYVLPIKREIRDRERIDIGDTAHVTIRLISD